jgi:hypothetical protein
MMARGVYIFDLKTGGGECFLEKWMGECFDYFSGGGGRRE